MAPCRKKLMLFHTSPFMIFLTMCRNNFCTLFIVFYVTKIKTKMSQAGNNWVHVGTRALKRRHNWLRPVPTERFPQEEDEYWLYSSTIPSNPATLLGQRWILSPRTHYHAFKKSHIPQLRNRLIKAYEKVGCQLKVSLYLKMSESFVKVRITCFRSNVK